MFTQCKVGPVHTIQLNKILKYGIWNINLLKMDIKIDCQKKYAYFFIFFQLDDVNHMTNIPPFEKKNNFFQMRFLIIVQNDTVVIIMG